MHYLYIYYLYTSYSNADIVVCTRKIVQLKKNKEQK